MILNCQLLDCTLRDGGHQNNWHFSLNFVQNYLNTLEDIGISFCELGYRKPKNLLDSTHGLFFKTTEETLKKLTIPKKLEIAVMIDLKDFLSDDETFQRDMILEYFDEQKNSSVKTVRIAAHYWHQNHILNACHALNDLGYKTSVNLMRSGNTEFDLIEKTLHKLKKHSGEKMIDVLTFADSFGNMSETFTKDLFQMARNEWGGKLGFHAHDNNHLALKNSLIAVNEGADFIDSTLSGLGKGEGNTKTQDLLKQWGKSCEKLSPLIEKLQKEI